MAFDTERSRVAHLLRRAGFGTSEAELDEYTSLGFAESVERLLAFEQVDDSATDATLANLVATLPLDLTRIEDVKFWWFNRMLATRRPLVEKMALFWHNHFATANSKVGNTPMMAAQIQLFRDAGLGSFESLLQQVTRDPAMLKWLDNRQNRKAAPNENYAREVMELFTVGIGNYTDIDVKEAARAFTGYTFDVNLAFVFQPANHDNTLKTFMGVQQNWDANDVLATLVRHPATQQRIPGKLFRAFVHDNPSAETLNRLATTYMTSGFDIRAVVRDILTGPEFLSPQAFHARIKSPVELVAGSLKALNVANMGRDVTQIMRRMGQDLLNPPDVSGWAGGATWINSSTLFERFNFANRLATARNAVGPYFTDIASQVRWHSLTSAESVLDYFAGLLVDGDLTSEARGTLLQYVGASPTFTLDDRALDFKVRGLVHLLMSLPTFQMA